MEEALPRRWKEVSLMFQLQRAKHNAIQTALTHEGLQDVGQPRILFFLSEEVQGELPAQKELARQLHVSSATVAASLKSLERMGYITRVSNAEDARKKRISITDKGVDARTRCRAVFDWVDEQLFSGFLPEEVDQLREYYNRMLENLAAIGGRGERCPAEPPPLPCIFDEKEGNH